MVNNIFKILFSTIFLLVLISSTFAVANENFIPSTAPCWVKGSVQGSGFDINGVTIGAYSGNTLLKSQLLSASADNNAVFSFNSIGAITGETISIKVLGANFRDFNFTGFCKTDGNPWIVLEQITVSKQANGVACTDNGICSSGYCSTTCQTRPIDTGGSGSGGGGGGGGGGMGVPSVEPGTTVVSETTENIDSNQSELRNALEEMKDEQGNSLYTSTEVAEMVDNSADYEFTRTVLVQKIVSTTGETTFKITVTNKVRNKSTDELKDVVVVVEVPKIVASSASQITSLLPFTVIVNDPVLEFKIAGLKAGQSENIEYSITKSANLDLSKVNFADPVIRTATIVTVPTIKPDNNADLNNNNPTTPIVVITDGEKEAIESKWDLGWVSAPMIIIPIILIIVIILVVSFMKKGGRDSGGLTFHN